MSTHKARQFDIWLPIIILMSIYSYSDCCFIFRSLPVRNKFAKIISACNHHKMLMRKGPLWKNNIPTTIILFFKS